MLLVHYLEQGLSKSAIAERLGIDRRTIHRWIAAGELERDAETGRLPAAAAPEPTTEAGALEAIVRTRLDAYPELSSVRATRARAWWPMPSSCASPVTGIFACVPAAPTEHVPRARSSGRSAGSTPTSRTGQVRDFELRSGSAFAEFLQNRFFLGEQFQLVAGLRLELYAYERNILRTRVRRTDPATGAATRLPEDVA